MCITNAYVCDKSLVLYQPLYAVFHHDYGTLGMWRLLPSQSLLYSVHIFPTLSEVHLRIFCTPFHINFSFKALGRNHKLAEDDKVDESDKAPRENH